MAEFTEVYRQYYRMCDSVESCSVCPLAYKSTGIDCGCETFIKKHTDRAEKIIMDWANSHPEKTLADVFIERNPEAVRTPWNTPLPCPHHVGLTVKRWCESVTESSAQECVKCWSRPYEK